MNRFACVVMGLGLAATLPMAAQQAEDRRIDDKRPPREEGRLGKEDTLTEAQKVRVKAILSKYDASTLTAEQAKAIHAAFRQAGIRGGPAMNDTVKAAGFDPDKLRDLAPPPGQDGGKDRRPPSREGDQEQGGDDRPAPRGMESRGQGHNPMFLNRVAGNVVHVLNADQRTLFQDLAAEQASQFEQLAMKRLPLIKAFHRELAGDIPKGSAGLDCAGVTRFTGDIFAYDAELSYRRAEVFGKVASSFAPEQKAYFDRMKLGDFNTWPDLDERDMLRRPARGTSRLYNVA